MKNNIIQDRFNKSINNIADVLTAIFPLNLSSKINNPIQKNYLCSKSNPEHFRIGDDKKKAQIVFPELKDIEGLHFIKISPNKKQALEKMDLLLISLSNKLLVVDPKVIIDCLFNNDCLDTIVSITPKVGYTFLYHPSLNRSPELKSLQLFVDHEMNFMVTLEHIRFLEAVLEEYTINYSNGWITKLSTNEHIHLNDGLNEDGTLKTASWTSKWITFILKERQPVYGYNTTTKQEYTFESVKQASEISGVNSKYISMIINNKHDKAKSASGIWVFIKGVKNLESLTIKASNIKNKVRKERSDKGVKRIMEQIKPVENNIIEETETFIKREFKITSAFGLKVKTIEVVTLKENIEEKERMYK